MSLKPQVIPHIPDDTKRVAQTAFPRGNISMRMRDELGTLYHDEQFVEVFPHRGQPAHSPWRLALICVMQYVENLSDRQAADAVRARIDWKYALSLELTDAGFDSSVLSEFRRRLVNGRMEQHLLDTMLDVFEAHGLLGQRGKQRTDSSHVVAAIRALNRLESLGETLRATLNSLAVAAPQWLVHIAEPDWFDRYGKRIEASRLPKGEAPRKELAETMGRDGMTLLEALYSAHAPHWLAHIPAVEPLRRTWVHHDVVIDGHLQLREAKDLPPASLRSDSPYDPEARYGTKRDVHWTGDTVHLTETCEPQLPHIITHVETPMAPQTDVETTASIHEALAGKQRLPSHHVVDGGYVSAE
jgi:transposase